MYLKKCAGPNERGYKNAKEVIVSLGESSPVIDTALTELQSINKIFDEITPARYIPSEVES